MQGEAIRDQTSYVIPSFEASLKTENQPVPDGPSINVIDRAFYLLTALDYFAKASGDFGYSTITRQNENGNKSKIRHLEKNAKEYLSKGRVAFLSANNLNPNIKNSISKELLIARTVVESDEFKDTYTGPGTEEKRRILRKQLFRQIELLNALE